MKRIIAYFLHTILFFSCSPKEQQYLLKETKSSQTKIKFTNTLKENLYTNIINYIYFYNGGGIALGDINNDNLVDIVFTANQGKNKLYLNKGGLQFQDISKTSEIGGNADWSSGVTMVDINQDGYLDIYVSNVSGVLNFKGRNELYINNGNNTFTERAEEYGLAIQGNCTQAYFLDYDKDNDLDVFIIKHAVHTVSSHGPASNRVKRTTNVGDLLLENRNGKFIDVSDQAGIYGGPNGYALSASLADYNNDGWTDIYVCNDFHEDDYLYINQQNGQFREMGEELLAYTSRFSMGSDNADINGDGNMDLITLDMLPYDQNVLRASDGDVDYNIETQLNKLGYNYQYSRNMLQINTGEAFYEAGQINGVDATDWSWSPLFLDINLDGIQDLYVTNGVPKRPNDLDFMNYISNSYKQRKNNASPNKWLVQSLNAMPSGVVPNKLFLGEANNPFQDKTTNLTSNRPVISNGAAYADLDNDGDIDIVTNNLNEKASILENQLQTKKNYLKVKLSYIKGNLNGLGSKVSIYADNLVQHKEIGTSKGFLSAVEPALYFGFGNNSTIDSIIIKWPNQRLTKLNKISTNQFLTINYNASKSYESNSANTPNTTPSLNKVALIDFKHEEDDFAYWDKDKLSPQRIDNKGPALAVGDLNNDGIDDVFIGNGSGYKAGLFLTSKNKLKRIHDSAIENDSLYQDNEALIFDFDNDGDNDLYVVSAISKKVKNSNPNRLYLNNGKGVFTKLSQKSDFLSPTIKVSCVKTIDYNEDGYLDLIIAAYSDEYFASPSFSILLKNEKGKKLSIHQKFKNLSKVTDILVEDIDSDGKKELIFAREWNSIAIFQNKNGKFVDTQNKFISSQDIGLWQNLSFYDYDNDGKKDIVCGNLGQNNKLQKYVENGVFLYTHDFDKNGKLDPILSVSLDGKNVPFFSKKIMANPFPEVNKKTTSFKQYAATSVEELFEDATKASKTRLTTLSNGYYKFNGTNFENFIPFPKPLQINSISNSIATNNKLYTFGNNFNFHPNIGRIYSKHQIVNSNKKTESFILNEQFSKARLVKLYNEKYIILGINKGKIVCFKLL